MVHVMGPSGRQANAATFGSASFQAWRKESAEKLHPQGHPRSLQIIQDDYRLGFKVYQELPCEIITDTFLIYNAKVENGEREEDDEQLRAMTTLRNLARKLQDGT
ncbi:hypothetical protein K437DRAFT_270904 [Tilletiaria anomala UBC 951]|uniref:Uncharacterized protein n=1 Tax=Tilletiaria anomala (strain ATCC 24038 / CBS 436.72 / UBC 951) TaxID=1037660 RepID=A0A066V721_TILAU|nr:uncharacterized protein K437DRAFT_270904 [Tilletiaria anomala UBC 951]KDN37266.1 hypothetical protein K437DRAFT_270904 [Tilletiaria anomala UBC 951]